MASQIPSSGDEVAKTSPPRALPLSAFKRLSRNVSLYEPAGYASNASPADASASSSSPTTILFCAWMNAAPKHIDYYTRTYMRLYPSARIIVTTISSVEFLFQSEVRRRADIKEAVTALLAAEQTTTRGGDRLVVHSISNGGAKRMYGVSGAYLALTGRPLPVKAWVIDSAPGIPKFRRDMYALTLPFKHMNWFIWAPLYGFTLLAVSAVYVAVNWMPRWFWKELVWAPTQSSNDPAFMNRKAVRGYVYSKEDLAINWQDVEMHAKIAENNGFRVLKKRVEGAGHAVMFKGTGGEDDYWNWVTSVLKTGLESE